MKNSSTFGYYKTKSEVKNAIQQFNTIGVNKDEISIFYPEQKHLPFAKEYTNQLKTRALFGAIIGTVTGSRCPKDNIPNEKDISPGNILFSVKLSPHQDEAQVKEVFRTSGASDIDTAKNSESWETKILPLT